MIYLTGSQIERCMMDASVSRRHRSHARSMANWLQEEWLPSRVGLTGASYSTKDAWDDARAAGVISGGWLTLWLLKVALLPFVQLIIQRWRDAQS